MEFLFEDNGKSMLCRIYSAAYSTNVLKHFHFTRGSGNIRKYILANFDNEAEICVFLDMPPGNLGVRDIYISLCDLRNKQNFSNMIVMPIVCREYYYLKHLSGSHLVVDQRFVNMCLGFTPPSIVSKYYKDLDDTMTFEKMCKYAAKAAIDQCARIGKVHDNEDGYRPYLKQDCLCAYQAYQNTHCNTYFFNDKAKDIVAMFPVFPTGSIISNVVHHDWASAVTEHRKYVDRYNKISQRMHKQDSILDYRDIGYMI